MTTFSGLVLIEHYLRVCRIHHRARYMFKSFDFKGDYGIADILSRAFAGYNPVKRCKGHCQPKLFSPDNGQYDYSVVVTENKNRVPDDLLYFMAGRKLLPASENAATSRPLPRISTMVTRMMETAGRVKIPTTITTEIRLGILIGRRHLSSRLN